MKRFAVSAFFRLWLACLLWSGIAALAQPATLAPAAEASDRQALLERLRDAQTRLGDLELSIRELERRLGPGVQASEPEPEPQTPPVRPAMPTLPEHWLWLGVLTIVILMIGITYSGRPVRKDVPDPATSEEDMAQFQNRLGRLDLSLGPLADTQHPPAEPDRHRP